MLHILEKLLPEIEGIELQDISIKNDSILIQLTTTQHSCLCPICGNFCHRMHSQYNRQLADLPWSNFLVKIRLRARKFFCDNNDCIRKIFTERFGENLTPYARCTTRFKNALQEIGFAVGGNGGSLLAKKLGIDISPSTFLRVIHRSSISSYETPRVLGVDDWAFKKGNNYGTILVDLEKRQPIDLLPDRTAETLKKWLEKHPGVEIISRDRSGSYALGATQGAPEAIQVADRWHLLKNLGEAVKRVLDGENVELRKVAETIAKAGIIEIDHDKESTILIATETKPEECKEVNELNISVQEAKFLDVKRLKKEGHSIKSIRRQTGVHRQTIKKYFKYDQYPHTALTRRRKTTIYKYEDFIRQEWEAGKRNKAELWRKIRSQGFKGSKGRLYEFVKDYPVDENVKLPKPLKLTIWSARKVSILISQKFENLKEEEQNFLRILYRNCPEINEVSQLVRRFKKMTDELGKRKLDTWIQDAQASQVPALKTFANGLLRDYDAVKAAVSLKWSNGQVEGQVNRLKNIKRQMYGRGGFELLKKKVLRHTG